MSITAPVVRWPGSKWRQSEYIIANMPRHDCYLESHFGSGAVFFSKAPSSVEVINDLDSLVVNLFRLVRDQPEQLATAISLTPWAREEYDACRSDVDFGDDVERARRLLVAMWQSIGTRRASSDDETAVASCGWRSRFSLHQSPVATWQRLPERIRVAGARLLAAQIENRPALDVIARHADPDVLIYADPPYVRSTRGLAEGDGKRLYAHEMTDAEHIELLAALKNHPGPVLLSGYHCALYEKHLDWHRVNATVRIQNNQTRTETLYLNPVAVHRIKIERENTQHRLFDIPHARSST